MGSVFGRVSEETPKFALVKKLTTNPNSAGVEIRRYAPNVAIQYDRAAAPSNSERNKDENSGFMKLAGYIGVTGKAQNARQESIAMTAPVVMTKNRKMEFILPSKFERDETDGGEKPPAPTNPDVHVVKRDAVLMAVKTFSGNWGDEAFDVQKNELLRILAEDSEIKDSFRVKKPFNVETYRYNPPWTLSFLRTNEVAIEIEEV